MARPIVVATLLLVTIMPREAHSQQCYVPGECIGQLVGSFQSYDRYECLSVCSNVRDCTWFSSNGENGFCGLFETCEEVSTENCSQCVSGEYNCEVLRCGIIGECKGNFITEDNRATEHLCQDFCTSYTGCSFYTYHKNTNLCLLFEDCPEVNNCQSCVSGQPGCYAEGGSQTTEQPSSTTSLSGTTSSPLETTTDNSGEIAEYLFLVGGGGATRRTEIVSLTEGGQIPDCIDTLSDHPNQLYLAAGGALPDAGYLPHVCGSSYYPLDECWQYSPEEDSWTKTSTIPREVAYAASAYHPGWGIIISGGCVSLTCYDEVTITKDGEVFDDLAATLLYTSYDHCTAAINANMLFTTGLGDGKNETTMYYKDRLPETYILPDLPTGRDQMGCGVVMNGSGSAEVVVVGGYDYSYLNTVEIFNIEENTWRTAKNPFPTAFERPAVAQHEDTFFIVGGYNQEASYFDTIYRFEVSDESWTLMPNRMRYARYGATAMIVKSSIFPTCD